MPTASVEPQPSQSLPQNRLTIGFLMLWTLGSALFLAANRALEDSSPAVHQGTAYTVYLTFYALIQGLALTSLPLYLARRFSHRDGFPTQVGHWLLLVRGMGALAMLVGWACRVAIERFWGDESPTRISLYLTMQYLPISTVACIGYVVAWNCCRTETRLWRLTILLLIFNASVGMLITLTAIVAAGPAAVGYLPYTCNAWCINPVIGIFMILAAFSDRGQTRDFLHWAGIVSALGIIALPFLHAAMLFLSAAMLEFSR
jgi:hypothetical protein